MGADLILMALCTKEDQPRWDDVVQWVAANTRTVMERAEDSFWLSEIHGVDGFEAFQKVLKSAKELPRVFDGRDATTLTAGEYTLWVCGGTSWGDSFPGMDEIELLLEVAPEALRAGGFILEVEP